MNDSDHLLAAMPVPRAFFKLAAPAAAAQLINILYNLVDKMFIGRIPEVGKQALAGVGVPRRWFWRSPLLPRWSAWATRPSARRRTLCRTRL